MSIAHDMCITSQFDVQQGQGGNVHNHHMEFEQCFIVQIFNVMLLTLTMIFFNKGSNMPLPT